MLTHPGGRESLRPLPEALEPDHLVPPERPHVEVAELGGSAAFLPDSTLRHCRDDGASRADELLGFDRDAAPFEESSRVLGESLEIEAWAGVGELGAHHEQYERIENVVAGAKVAVPSSRVDVADDLDVVL
jgi:hypothetical protein